MSRSPRPVLLLAVLAALLLGAGCTTAVPGTAGPDTGAQGAAGTTEDPVAWTDRVCGALLPFVRTAAVPPSLDSAADPAALISVLSDYLGQASATAGTAATELRAVGPSPVEGGDELVSGLTQTVTTTQTSFQDAKAKIDALDPNDPQALLTTLPAAVAPLEQLANLPDPTAGLQNNAELDSAAQQAPNCQEVERTVGG
jgi:hypothetical protein